MFEEDFVRKVKVKDANMIVRARILFAIFTALKEADAVYKLKFFTGVRVRRMGVFRNEFFTKSFQKVLNVTEIYRTVRRKMFIIIG